MGQLSSLRIKREKVELDESQSFEVRAISTNDIMTLAGEHGATLAILFSKITDIKKGADADANTVRDIILAMAREFPEVASCVIALAADDYSIDGLKTANDLPFTVQVDAIVKVFGLTFASEGDVKKLIESLTKMLVGVSGTLTKLELPSHNGIGESVDLPTS